MNVIRLLIVLLSVAAAAHAEVPATRPAATDTAPKPASITVAVLDFTASDINTPDLGKVIGQTVTIMLAGEPGINLVDRASLDKVLQEQEINLTGLVETQQAIKVGKLVGARIIIVGKAFQLGQGLFITAKLIGTETTLVDGVLVKGDAGSQMDKLVLQLSQNLAERLRTSGPKLVASEDEFDPLPALQAALAGKPMPSIAVIVREEHIARQQPAANDPAVETEIKRLLRACGITVKDVQANTLNDWAKAVSEGKAAPWPQELSGVDLVVTGEGFSEFASQIGSLHSCTARAEINIVERTSGKIVVADRETTRAVDLSENLAGRTALQKAGRAMGIRFLEYLRDHAAEHVPQAPPQQQ